MNNLRLKVFIAIIPFFAVECNNQTDMEFVRHEVMITKPKNISFAELTNNIAKYNLDYIETKGIFYHSIEEMSLNNPDLKNDRTRSLWLDVEYPIDTTLVNVVSGKSLLGNNFWDKLNNRNIIVRGIVNTSKKGHLGQYIASIEKITYIKVE